jgi:DNA polymerase-3 subunit gamma/tau
VTGGVLANLVRAERQQPQRVSLRVVCRSPPFPTFCQLLSATSRASLLLRPSAHYTHAMADHDDLTTDSAPPWDEEPAERDENTADIFGGAPAEPTPEASPPVVATPVAEPKAAPVAEAPSASPLEESGAAYTVLARKYRPRTFEDLIGQEAMVRTLANAFSTGRIAHAFMLTGVRGVGKTTTARLLARALNYETDTVHQPSVDLTVDGRHCKAIVEGRHMDVLELDAASRTKVDEMRELLDGVRYAPVEARYKVYIIDEVHMLSTAAFNALLKTLEEPPPHAKFIFATTEIRKVPVTILSRTQRFDLRRVEPDVLVKHFARIAAKEGAKVEEDGLALIARAAEGSVRDGLSLLDQAIVQGERGSTVTAAVVRDMLGLADRGQTIALFENVMSGKPGESLKGFRALWGFGADPAVVMLDLLDHCHSASVAKALGPDALQMPKEQAARLTAIGAQTSAGSLSRLWQMLLKAHEEVRRAPDAMAAAEMALIRLCYAADLPGPEEALKALRDGATPGVGGRWSRRRRRIDGRRRFRRRRQRPGPGDGRARRSSGAGVVVVRRRREADRREARHRASAGRRAICPPDQLPPGSDHLRTGPRRAGQPGRPSGAGPEGMDRPALAGRGRGRRRGREPARTPEARGPRGAGLDQGRPVRRLGPDRLPGRGDRRGPQDDDARGAADRAGRVGRVGERLYLRFPGEGRDPDSSGAVGGFHLGPGLRRGDGPGSVRTP